MIVSRSLWPVGILALSSLAAAGCRKDEPPTPKAEPASAVGARSAGGMGRMNLRNNPLANMRIDPQAMKDYRVDVCHYGTYALEQARDAYLASLGKDEPSEKKIPNFGIPVNAASTPAAAAGSASAKPKAGPPKVVASASPSAAAQAGSADAPATRPTERHFDFARAPYERNARACSAAAALKEPAMGGVDEALKDYAPLAVELAKDIVAANNYYAKEEYKKDSFEKGKSLHKKLVEEFAKLDELHEKVGKALDAFRKEHPADLSKADEGQKLGTTLVDDGKAVILAAVGKKPDMAAFKAAVAKLGTDGEALKARAQATPTDPWGKILVTPLETFLRTAKEGEAKIETHDAETYLSLVNGFVGMVEARQRALSRSMQRPNLPMMAPVAPAAPVASQPAPKPE